MADAVFLLPGEMHFAKEQTRISTLLGSCVALVLYHPGNGWGGVNHFMLPDMASGKLPPGKCGDQACAMLLKMAVMSGCVPGDLQAYIIGGGKVSGHLASSGVGGLNDVGDRNIATAKQFCQAHGIKVLRTETGGNQGRKIQFTSSTGQLEVSIIPTSTTVAAASTKAEEFKRRKIKVLVVDDSQTVRELLKKAIAGQPDLEVIGEAEDPFKARELMLQQDPDVICLDIIMPKLDGLSFLKRLMAYKPIPTVIVSTIAKQGSEMHRKLTEGGAVAILDKEELKIYAGIDTCRAKLLPVLRKAAVTAVTRIG